MSFFDDFNDVLKVYIWIVEVLALACCKPFIISVGPCMFFRLEITYFMKKKLYCKLGDGC